MNRRLALAAAYVLLAASCGSGAPVQDVSRSEGKPVARLTTAQQVEVYRAAINAAFDVGPNLVLLLHPTRLPRGAGFSGGSNVDDALFDALRASELVAGRCTPKSSGNALRAPSCAHGESGYVVRASEAFQRAGDTLQFYLLSEMYATTGGPGLDAFSFEMAYRLTPTADSRFRVVAEGRVRQVGKPRG